MNIGGLQTDIETLVRLLPRPLLNGQQIIKSQNSWLIVEEYDGKEGIVVMNKITNPEGRIPYDSIRRISETGYADPSCTNKPRKRRVV